MPVTKLIIEVMAGIIPGQPMDEHTQRWTWTSDDEAQLRKGNHEQMKWANLRYVFMAGQSREYAASLENPQRFNWVRRDWIWL